MNVELVIPEVGESITEVQVGRWLKGAGDHADQDEGVVEIETDKVSFEIPAPVGGRITKILLEDGAAAKVGDVVGIMEEVAEDAEGGGGDAGRSGQSATGAEASESPADEAVGRTAAR